MNHGCDPCADERVDDYFMLQPIFSDLWTLPVPLQLTAVLTRVSLVSRTGATSEPVRPRLLNAAPTGPVALDVVGSYESLGFG